MDCNILDSFIKSKSDDNTCNKIFFGLNNNLSNSPLIIRFSKVSMPLAKASFMEKPN